MITASCTDEIQNQDETDVDCGGSSCNACRKYSGAYIFREKYVTYAMITLRMHC